MMLKRVLIIVFVLGGTLTGFSSTLFGSTADDAVEHLRSANELRSQRAQEEQAWLLEKERQDVLLSSLSDELERIEAKRKALLSQIKTLEVERPKEVVESSTKLATFMTEIATLIETELQSRQSTLPPGALPSPLLEEGPPADALASALKTISEAERRAAQISIELVEGKLGATKRSVELLRMGGLAAWWSSLDGSESGTAIMQNGELILELSTESATTNAISQAIRIARGRAAPSLVSLPYQPIHQKGGQP